MDKRHSSPSPRASSPRPRAFRKRSNSLPIVEALGCSTPEAELILAEGRAAVRSRYATHQRRGRRNTPKPESVTTFRPQDHLQYLNESHQVTEDKESSKLDDASISHHVRTLSHGTDRSNSTITPTAASASTVTESTKSPTSPLWDYSANLAKFVQSQLNAISAYNPISYRISVPGSPAKVERSQSEISTERRSLEKPSAIEIPPIRPPLRSAFSAWSSTDDGTEDEPQEDFGKDDSQLSGRASRASNYTPSAILRYYEHGSGSSFLLTSTPLEEEEQVQQEPNVKSSPSNKEPTAPIPIRNCELDYDSSSLSNHPILTSSSAPSLSSVSTASYFECKRSRALPVHVKDRLLAVVSPFQASGKVLSAISPFEGGALANVHDVYVESQNKVLVDGLSFDLLRSSNAPN